MMEGERPPAALQAARRPRKRRAHPYIPDAKLERQKELFLGGRHIGTILKLSSGKWVARYSSGRLGGYFNSEQGAWRRLVEAAS